MPMTVKEVIMRLRKKKFRDIGQTITLRKQTVWNIVKKEENTAVCLGLLPYWVEAPSNKFGGISLNLSQ